MDLTLAEAVMDIIRANTPLALRAAALQLEGRLGRGIEALRDGVLETVANLEAWIDFPEEGIDPASGRELLAKISSLEKATASLLSTACASGGGACTTTDWCLEGCGSGGDRALFRECGGGDTGKNQQGFRAVGRAMGFGGGAKSGLPGASLGRRTFAGTSGLLEGEKFGSGGGRGDGTRLVGLEAEKSVGCGVGFTGVSAITEFGGGN
jgi:hypothetical protein